MNRIFDGSIFYEWDSNITVVLQVSIFYFCRIVTFDYFGDVSQMELGEHSILVQLLDEKDKVISEKDLKINII